MTTAQKDRKQAKAEKSAKTSRTNGPPEGWEANPGVVWGDDAMLVASRTYPDGSRRELTADSPDEFARTALLTDEQVRVQQSARHAGITEQIREHQREIDRLSEQAALYEWALDDKA